MTNTSKTIVFFGNERLVSGLPSTDAPVLRGLIAQGYKIAAVVSNHTDAKSRNGRKLEVADIAQKYDIPVLLPSSPLDIYDQLADMQADIAVLSAYGRIVPQKIIDLFPFGIVNVHPSLLPKYRGSTPIESAILNGDTETGVSIMQLSAEMDAGPIYAQQKTTLTGKEEKFELYEQLSKIGAELLLTSLPCILSGELTPTPQSGEPVYCQLLTKQDGVIDWKKSAIQLEREIRAFKGWPKSRTTLGTREVVITKAHVALQKETQLEIECRDGQFLSIDELIGPSGRTMSAKDFLNGYAAA